uniref:Uncharacterized protein n=1 Tax=Arundo donax TaxID=35708 RepID=A0A0A8YTY1_ARUDO
MYAIDNQFPLSHPTAVVQLLVPTIVAMLYFLGTFSSQV